MMKSDEVGFLNKSVSLKFHGSGFGYFKIHIVNLVLTILTLGIYSGWAIVRSKRYFYSNTEISGARFSYQGSGGSILISWLFFIFLYVGFILTVKNQNNTLLIVMVAVFVLFFPYLLMQGVRYQAMVTSLNGIRFNYVVKGNVLKGWWAIYGCGLVLISLLVGACILVSQIASLSTVGFVFFTILALVAFAIIQGVSYAVFINFHINNMQFGNRKFITSISKMKCVKICMVTFLIAMPFLFAAYKVISPVFMQLIMLNMHIASSSQIDSADLTRAILIGYGFYIVAIITAFSYAHSAMCRYCYQVTKLDGGIGFRSTLTFIGCLWLVVSNLVLIVCTLGLGYPWAQVRAVRYTAKNTWIEGDLEAFDVRDHNEFIDKELISRLSRGVVTSIRVL